MINIKKILERELGLRKVVQKKNPLKKQKKLRQHYTYTKDELIKILQDLAEELGRVPKVLDLRYRSDLPSSTTYKYHFRFWNKALEAAGLSILHKRYTVDELIKLLQKLAQELGRIPTIKDLKESNLPLLETYKLHFDSWDNALREAGLIE